MVAPVNNFDPKTIARRISETAIGAGGRGTHYFIASVVQWKEKSFDVGGPSSKDFIYFWGSNKKQQCDGREGGGARSVPFVVALSSKRRVREAHGRARAAKTH
jgi:hypothetical protein